MLSYAERKAELIRQVQDAGGQQIGLGKETSNLFRDRKALDKRRLDVRRFDHVLEVNSAEGWVDVEAMTPYDALVDSTLRHGVMPAVVPQLRSITLGGAVAGVGIEATSFRCGLVHETVLELDVALHRHDARLHAQRIAQGAVGVGKAEEQVAMLVRRCANCDATVRKKHLQFQ